MASFAVSSMAGATVLTATVVGEDPPVRAQATLLLSFDSEEQPAQRFPIAIGVPFEVPHTATLARATIELEGYWSEEISMGANSTRSATIRLAKATDIGFPIEARPDAEFPDEISANFETVPSYGMDATTDDLAGSTACEVREGTAYCRLPTLKLDLRFSPDGYAPFYLWGVALGEGRPDPAPAVKLERGGTIIGHAVDERGDPVLDAHAYLMPPLTGRKYDPIMAARLRRLALESTSNERGFFQLVGIPDGSYRVILDKAGFATSEATPEPILVQESEHVLADSVTLPPAPAVVLVLTPEFDPKTSPWKVQAHPRNSIKHLAAESTTLHYRNGRYSAEGLVPGTYDLMVESSVGERWWIEPIEVRPGSQHLTITMDHFTVNGTVMAGDTPVAGQLILRNGGASLEFRVDEDGEFTDTLPEPGCWGVRLLPSEQQGVEIALPCEPVEPADGVATLKIELPETRIQGEVVDSLGQPVEEATVRVHSKASGRALSIARSDSDGEFSLLGVPPGPAALMAEHSDRESESREMMLDEGQETPWQVLTLREKGEVTGQVSTSNGSPLVGAQVVLWPELGAAPGARIAVTATDMNGAFRASVPVDVGWLNLIVSAPGFGTRILREPSQRGQPLLIELEPGGGQLLLELAASEDTERSLATIAGRAVVAYDGVTVPLQLLRVVAVEAPPISVTGRMQLEGMAQGNYSLCTNRSSRSSDELATPGEPTCSSVFLPRGGRALLSAGTPAGDS